RSSMVTGLPFGARAQKAQQTRILRSALASIRPDRPAAAFDIDSTILSNKPRQARIVREYGQLHGDPRLAACTTEAIRTWDLRDTMRHCGLGEGEIAALVQDLRGFWMERFFTSEYSRDDTPVPGARDYLRKVLAAGGEVLYITGRPREMESGTLAAFQNAGFPLPAGEQVQLWLKPSMAEDDDRWKELCHARLREMRAVACAFDNEP